MKKILISLISITSASFIVGCSSNKAPVDAPIVASSPMTSNVSQDNSQNINLSNRKNNAVFFGFDKYNVEAQYSDVLNDNSTYLVANPTSKVQIQGNTDEIGSVEYNLALGQKRADIVKKTLIMDGVNQNQIEAISNGKLKPAMSNFDNAGRAYNRRADIFYNGEYKPNWYVIHDNLPLDGQLVISN